MEGCLKTSRGFVAVYITLYKDSGIERDFSFSGSDWNGLITMVRADVECSGEGRMSFVCWRRSSVWKTRTALIGGELKRLKGGEAILIFV